MDTKLIDQAISILNSGGIVIYPTDTAFGIGCRIDKVDAIKKILQIKQKPIGSTMPVLVSSIEMAEKYWTIPLPVKIKNLLKKYWPGGLTVVYFANKLNVPKIITGNTKTVGIRMPNHQDLITIIEKLGVPIVGTSANFFGEKTVYNFGDLNQEVVKQVDLILPGICITKKASTVVDCTQNPWKILRRGNIFLLEH